MHFKNEILIPEDQVLFELFKAFPGWNFLGNVPIAMWPAIWSDALTTSNDYGIPRSFLAGHTTSSWIPVERDYPASSSN